MCFIKPVQTGFPKDSDARLVVNLHLASCASQAFRRLNGFCMLYRLWQVVHSFVLAVTLLACSRNSNTRLMILSPVYLHKQCSLGQNPPAPTSHQPKKVGYLHSNCLDTSNSKQHTRNTLAQLHADCASPRTLCVEQAAAFLQYMIRPPHSGHATNFPPNGCRSFGHRHPTTTCCATGTGLLWPRV